MQVRVVSSAVATAVAATDTATTAATPQPRTTLLDRRPRGAFEVSRPTHQHVARPVVSVASAHCRRFAVVAAADVRRLGQVCGRGRRRNRRHHHGHHGCCFRHPRNHRTRRHHRQRAAGRRQCTIDAAEATGSYKSFSRVHRPRVICLCWLHLMRV